MVCLTLTEEMMNDQKKIDEALIKNLSPNCEIHKTEKATICCINCSHSICHLCEKDHSQHELVNKNKLISFEEKMRENSADLYKRLQELGLDTNLSDFYKTFRQDLNKQCEELVEVVEEIKKKQIKIMNGFKINFESLVPSLLDYKDTLDELILHVSESKKERILKNDKEFVDFYSKYKKTIAQDNRMNENIDILKKKMIKYRVLFTEFKNRIEEILNFINDHYEKIKDFNPDDTREDNMNMNFEMNLNPNFPVNMRSGEGIIKNSEDREKENNFNNFNNFNTPNNLSNRRYSENTNPNISNNFNTNSNIRVDLKKNSNKEINVNTPNRKLSPMTITSNNANANYHQNINPPNNNNNNYNQLINPHTAGNFYSQTGNNNFNENQIVNNINHSSANAFYSSNNFNHTAKSKQSNTNNLNPRASTSSKINLFNLMTTSPVRGRSIVDNFDVLKKKEKSSNNNNLNNFNSNNSNNIDNQNKIPEFNQNNILDNIPIVSSVNLNFNSGEIIAENNFNSQGVNFNSNKNIPLNKIYNIEVSTKNIFIYDNSTKNIYKKELNLSSTNIKRFEAYHSTINYNNKFYLSGGYGGSAKIFYEFDLEKIEMESNYNIKKLKDMPNGHSYHTLIGIRNYIFAVSGFNSKKCDKYCIDNDTWSTLPDLSICRSWPSVINHEDRYLFVFGGVKESDKDKKGNKTFEKIDLKGTNLQWEILEVKIEDDFPFYFGIVNRNTGVIFLGGKFTKIGENSDKCYKFNLTDTNLEEINVNELRLPYKDAFDGRMFLSLDEEGKTFGQFSAIFSNRFYIFNTEANTFQVIETKEA
jgi:hypothetical protein